MEMEDVRHEDIEDLSMGEVIKKCEEIMSSGGVTFIKFTCSACGSRQTSINPNTIHTAGYHCEECGTLNKPKKYGILAIFYSGPYEELVSMIYRFLEKEKEKGNVTVIRKRQDINRYEFN